ncbi:MAG: tryptophan--tRNA ligase [Candidatus Andersenbacteria bacterium]
MEKPTDQKILSGVQPSGVLHLGNYLGAIKQWVDLQEGNTAYYCIVDEHAITVPYDPKTLPDRVLDTAAMYLAAGLDPNQSVIFVQSHVPAHTELAWLLSTTTPFGEMNRMTQFKEKKAKQKEQSTLGLFSYPVLMAADILLYQANIVPVGEDQTQHVELTRDIAKRFNSTFGEVFTIPKAYIPEGVARIMSLTDPKKKMSKSDSDKSYIALTDEPDVIRKKIASAVTDTKPIFSFEKSGSAVKNLLTIYRAFSDSSTEDIEANFANKGYKEFKEELADVIISALTPIQERYKEIRVDEAEMRVALGRGAHQAQSVANQTLHRVKEKMGLM